jgi:hypothetical protein
VLAQGKLVRSHGKSQYTGTYFRMLLPGGVDKYFSNPDSRATDKTYTLLRPGSEGGLQLGSFQRPPSPAFSSSGFALADRIVEPEKFASIDFSISTAPNDAQSGAAVTAPTLTLLQRLDGGMEQDLLQPRRPEAGRLLSGLDPAGDGHL